MRRPTSKEAHTLLRCYGAIDEDLKYVAVNRLGPSADVYGTLRANLETMLSILSQLEQGQEKP